MRIVERRHFSLDPPRDLLYIDPRRPKMNTCPLTRQPCNDEIAKICPLRIKLEDFEGCPFDLADRAIQDFKINTLIPAALKLDEFVRKYLTREE